MLCPNCETANRDGAKFCDECGFPLTGAIARAAAASTSAPDAAEAANAPVAPVAVETPDASESPDAAEAVKAPVAPEAPVAADEAPVAGASAPAEQAAPVADETPAASIEADETVEIPVPLNDERIEGETPNAEGDAADKDDIEDYDIEEYAPENYRDPDSNPNPDVTGVIGPDLAGLDQEAEEYGERVVGPGYEQPQANWRDGHTMQMPRLESDEAPRSKDFLASSTAQQKKSRKVVIGVVIAVVLVAAAVVFATYQMQLWGGKVVPDVHDLTEADATSVLEDSGFSVRSTQVKSDDTEGLVLITDPAAGSRAEEGSEIVIHIATSRSIPDVVGKKESEAKKAIDDEGYVNVTYETERSDSEEGTVLSISPEPGMRAKSSISVIVKVAEPYKVPEVSSLSLDEAAAAVKTAGLRYDVNYVDTTDYPEGTVLGCDPVAGTKVKSDTVVFLNVARARGVQLTELTKGLITPGSTLEVGGTSYIVSTLDSVSYMGNDQVSFTATGRPYTVFFGVYVEGEAQPIAGVVTWSADNQVLGIS